MATCFYYGGRAPASNNLNWSEAAESRVEYFANQVAELEQQLIEQRERCRTREFLFLDRIAVLEQRIAELEATP